MICKKCKSVNIRRFLTYKCHDCKSITVVDKKTSKEYSSSYNKGVMNHKSILNPDKVREARKLRKSGWLVREIAEKFEVSKNTMNSVFNKANWSWVKDEECSYKMRIEDKEYEIIEEQLNEIRKIIER